jgi:hypothetical protein
MVRPIADFITDAQLGPRPGEPLPHRQCDGCVQCCIALGIEHPELRKPPNVPCPHLASAGGCGIYSDRPSVCRLYQCLWRLMKELPDEARPDKCGVVFSFHWNRTQPDLFEYSIVATAVNAPSDFDHPAARAALDTLVGAEAMPVWLDHSGRRHLLFPDAELADAILHPATTTHRHLVERAAALRRKWEISAAAGQPGP